MSKIKWSKGKGGIYYFEAEATYAAIVPKSKRRWSLLLSAVVNGKTVRYGGDHPTMADAIAKAHALTHQ
jgi:hypothetical protein